MDEAFAMHRHTGLSKTQRHSGAYETEPIGR